MIAAIVWVAAFAGTAAIVRACAKEPLSNGIVIGLLAANWIAWVWLFSPAAAPGWLHAGTMAAYLVMRPKRVKSHPE